MHWASSPIPSGSFLCYFALQKDFWRGREMTEPEEVIGHYRHYGYLQQSALPIGHRVYVQQLAIKMLSLSFTTGNRRRLSMYTI